jgi:hypothetical protein
MLAFAIIGVLIAAAFSAFRRRDASIDSHPRGGARTHGLRAPGARSNRATVQTQQLRTQARTLFRR